MGSKAESSGMMNLPSRVLISIPMFFQIFEALPKILIELLDGSGGEGRFAELVGIKGRAEKAMWPWLERTSASTSAT